jgi:hypothetical protein
MKKVIANDPALRESEAIFSCSIKNEITSPDLPAVRQAKVGIVMTKLLFGQPPCRNDTGFLGR